MSTLMNPLPPQAYTKETLVHAYAWLQSQSENIKELATTPDVLVSLYLKAKLQGNGALERPSIQNFKNELKNLAGMMGEFEVIEPPPGGNSQGNQTIRIRSQDLRPPVEPRYEEKIPSYAPSQPLPTQTQFQTPAQIAQSFAQAHAQSQSLGQAQSQPQFQPPLQTHAQTHMPQQTTAPAVTTSSNPNSLAGLDARSMDMIQEVKIQFNLSSDLEAMRLLLANGYNQIKGLLK